VTVKTTRMWFRTIIKFTTDFLGKGGRLNRKYTDSPFITWTEMGREMINQSQL